MSESPFDISLQVPEEVSALGVSLRELIHGVIALGSIPETLSAELVQLREKVDSVCAQIIQHARADRVPRNRYDDSTGSRPYYVKGALIGEYNPLVPLVEVEHADGVTSGTVRFGAGYEGPPGYVHGGFVALFFDGILGHHNVVREIPAMTGTLKIRFRGPTPLLTDLQFEVRTAQMTKSKVVNEAWIAAAGERVCEAQGIFILPKPENFMGHMGKEIGLDL